MSVSEQIRPKKRGTSKQFETQKKAGKVTYFDIGAARQFTHFTVKKEFSVTTKHYQKGDNTMISDEQSICFHEAGHALVCDAVGGVVTKLVLHQAGGGSTGLAGLGDRPDDYAKTLAAGVAAEFFAAQFYNDIAEKGHYLYHQHAASDLDQFRQLRTRLTWPAAFDAAYAILSSRPTRLFALASALERLGYIDGDAHRATMPLIEQAINRAVTGGPVTRGALVSQYLRKWNEL